MANELCIARACDNLVCLHAQGYAGCLGLGSHAVGHFAYHVVQLHVRERMRGFGGIVFQLRKRQHVAHEAVESHRFLADHLHERLPFIAFAFLKQVHGRENARERCLDLMRDI